MDKYKAVEAQSREDVKGILDDLADIGSSYLKHYVPGPYREMTKHSKRAISCRIGNHDSERLQPFSGATVNLDFCAHNHKDFNNKDKGAIAVSWQQTQTVVSDWLFTLLELIKNFFFSDLFL